MKGLQTYSRAPEAATGEGGSFTAAGKGNRAPGRKTEIGRAHV